MQMIVLRALQGSCGGVLIPMSFYHDHHAAATGPGSRSERPCSRWPPPWRPAIGPTIGGWLTETWGWQTIFYVNLVPGAVMLLMLWLSLERKPMQLGLLRQGDWAGIATMALGLGALQSRAGGGQQGRTGSARPLITRLAIVAAVSLGLFVWIELTTAHPL